jgi:phosphatidate cytidylyltransferase
VYAAVVAAALAVASVEFNHARRAWLDPVNVLVALLVGGVAVGAYLGQYEWWAWMGAAGAIPLLAVALSPTDEGVSADAPWMLGGVAYLGALGGFIVLLRQWSVDDVGRDWVYLAVLSTFATDTGAYAVGRLFGRHRMAPRISPKKTWEGFAGGYAAGFGAVVGLNWLLGLRVDASEIVVLAALLPAAAVVGDLFESALKRRMGIKDASELIPGHGGVLDRLDSILLTFPVTYLFVDFVVG